MASLRRNKTLSPDGQTARFLYTIIKQLDLKAIDWNLVAASLEITNGHAARMRYSRFKQQIEGGATTQAKAPRAGKKDKEGKEGKEVTKPRKRKKGSLEEDEVGREKKEASASLVKSEPGQDIKDARVKREERGGVSIKDERSEEDTVFLGCDVKIKREPGLPLPQQPVAVVNHEDASLPTTIKVKPEPPLDDSTINPDIWRILPRHPASSSQVSLYNQTPRTILTPTLPALSKQPPPHHSPSTVSLADLEVSPRSRPTAIMNNTSSNIANPPARSSFVARPRLVVQQQPVPGREHVVSGTSLKIKTEPGHDDDLDWMICSPIETVLVKSEPVEA